MFHLAHLCFLVGGGVIVAHEMKQAMNEEKRDFFRQGPHQLIGWDAQVLGHSTSVLFRLNHPLGAGNADDDITQVRGGQRQFSGLVDRKRQDICGLVDPSPLGV